MIISCINCNKKFEVNSALIPSNGRLIECGSCNHKWFFKNENITNERKTLNDSSIGIIEKNIDLNNDNKVKTPNNLVTTKLIQKKDIKTVQKKINVEKKKKKLLNIILVFLISLIALVILIDTFKSPLNILIPSLELILYNLYESIMDIKLFFEDLI